MMIGEPPIRSVIFFLFLVRSSSQLAPHPMAIPGCPDSCGGVTVPYPFGLTPACSYENSTRFLLSCSSTSSGDPPQLLWGSLPVVDLNVQQGEMTLSLFISYDCYRGSRGIQLQNESFNNGYTLIEDSPFTISTKNKFTTIGCDTMGFLTGSWGKNFISGCVSYCQDLSSVDATNTTSCDGVGCCQTAVPKGTRQVQINVSSIDNYTNLLSQWTSNDLACGYAFLVREDNFTFHPSYLVGDDFLKSRPSTPVLVEWAIGGQNDTCEGMTDPCPAQHSECVRSAAATGYLCTCKDGFQGNPYLLNGCADIDECKKPDLQRACGSNLTCINTVGDYECRCSDNKTVILNRGREGYNCPAEKERSIPLYQRLIAACLSVAFLLLGVGRLCYRYKIAHVIKNTNFSRNGGLKLLQKIKSLDKDGSNMGDLMRFKERKLMKSINKGNIVSDPKDAHMGKVYKGRLLNEKVVVIKEVHLEEKEQKDVEEFVDNVVDLYKTRNHNILQLLGYCFETKAPLLVYKFNPICWHAKYDFYSLVEMAEKTADWFVNFPPGIAVRLTTIVQETMDFLPTGYFKEMTDASDVFCFGVVMAALFTGMNPWHQQGSSKNTVNHDLTKHCISLLNDALHDQNPREGDAGSRIVDCADGSVHGLIVELVKRCFQEDGERPILTMEHVLGELRNIKSTTTASIEHC